MSMRNKLKAGASRFMHLSAIPKGPKASKEETADDKAAREKSEKEAADKKKSDDEAAAAAAAKPAEGGENDDDAGDDEDEDEDGDEEEVKKASAAGYAPALAAATRIERRRGAAIFASEHAAGRLPLACELAFSRDGMKASSAIRILSAAQPENATNPLATALAEMPRHDIGIDASGKPGNETPDQRLVASAQARKTAKK